MDNILTFLNDTTVKTVLLFLGGLILKRWPAFCNKAIPVVLLIVSAVLAALKAMFPVVPPDAVPAMFQVAAVTWGSAGRWFVSTFLPFVIAVATQSASKNTVEWLRLGTPVIAKK